MEVKYSILWEDMLQKCAYLSKFKLHDRGLSQIKNIKSISPRPAKKEYTSQRSIS